MGQDPYIWQTFLSNASVLDGVYTIHPTSFLVFSSNFAQI